MSTCAHRTCLGGGRRRVPDRGERNRHHEAAQLAERLRTAVAMHIFEQVGQLTASFGVATSLPDDTRKCSCRMAHTWIKTLSPTV